MKLKTSLILSLTLLFYSVIYLATSKELPFGEDSAKLYGLDTTLSKKYDYFYGAQRCTYRQDSDTLCIYVKDTVGINWDRFADTVCMYANSIGLYRQKIFLVNNRVNPPDTVARKQCP